MCVESVGWEFLLLVSGAIAIWDYVYANLDEIFVNFAYETTLAVCPLLLAFIRAAMQLWSCLPVRAAAARLFPLLHSVLRLEY